MRILVAEDTPSLQALLQLCLARAGHHVDVVANGRDALERFKAGRYDLAILDIQMPVMSGLDAARGIRRWEADAGRAPVPLLALSANTERADRRKCLEAGCTETVSKPFNREELLAAIARRTPKADAGEAPLTVEVDKDFADLVPDFLKNCRSTLSRMKASAEARDFRGVSTAGHKLVGSGASFGFAELSEIARRIEKAAKKEDGGAVRAHLDELGVYLRSLRVVSRDG